MLLDDGTFYILAEPVNQDCGKSTLFGSIQILASFVAAQVDPVLGQAAKKQKSFCLRRRQARVGHPMVFSTSTFDTARQFARRIDLAEKKSCILSRASASRWKHESRTMPPYSLTGCIRLFAQGGNEGWWAGSVLKLIVSPRINGDRQSEVSPAPRNLYSK